MVAFHFPPLAGSSGIQRTLRFVQQLPESGWEPIVLSAEPRAYERTTEDLNRAEVYVRVPGFDADDYTLFVTAEQSRFAPAPSSRRVLRPKNASFLVK